MAKSKLRHRNHRGRGARVTQPRFRALRLEPLEIRRVLATFTVTNVNDSGVGSLRQAVDDANTAFGHDEIVFHASLAERTIRLSSEIDVTDSLNIQGPTPNADGIVVSGLGLSRIFRILGTDTLANLQNLTLTRGNASGGDGGAIVNNGELTLSNVVVSGSQAGNGGGIDNNGTLTIASGSQVIGNVAANSGGGVDNDGMGQLIIDQSTISSNVANFGGGVYNLSPGQVRVLSSTIAGNSATEAGGGIRNVSGSAFALTISNSTLAHNISAGATGGGAIATSSGTIVIAHATIVGNSDVGGSASGAGGISRAGGTLNVLNTIIANNVHTSAAQNNLNAGAINGTNTANFTSGNPMLGPLQDNGGLTHTMLPIAGSPVIDIGSNSSSVTLRDQRGFARRIDGNDNRNATVDIGAAEYLATGRYFVVNNTGDSSDSNAGDGLCDDGTGQCTLRAAIEETNALENDSPEHPDSIFVDLFFEVLSPTSDLPAITDAVEIDGTIGSGTPNPLIRIDGGGALNNGLSVNSDGVKIRGFSFTNFTEAGILINSANNCVVESNYLGLDTAGDSAGNLFGVKIVNSENTLIDNNVISGNDRAGVFVNSALSGANTIVNNLIGTAPNGVDARPNGTDGITNFAPATQIGLPGQGNTISGNARWGVFARFADRTGVVIQDNKIGTNIFGSFALPNSIGVYLQNGPNTIGGTDGEGNVISGNSAYGVAINLDTANGNVIQGNSIGTNDSGSVDVGNELVGVRITGGSSNLVGGIGQESNVISGNGLGVLVGFPDAADNLIVGNRIGTNALGTAAIANDSDGVRIVQGAHETIVAGNLISGNDGRGVTTDADSANNIIRFNRIGTDLAGTSPLPNIQTGGAVRLQGAGSVVQGNVISGVDIGLLAFGSATNLEITDNYFGTDESETITALAMDTAIKTLLGSQNNLIEGNVIANNQTGIDIASGTGNRITDNSIYDNAVIGIDLGSDGATANDVGDGDTGANNLQNAPQLTEATKAGPTLSLSYIVRTAASVASYPLTIEFFIGDGDGQGKKLIGTNMYTLAERFTEKSIAIAVSVSVGDEITATATDADGNTSEFAVGLLVTA